MPAFEIRAVVSCVSLRNVCRFLGLRSIHSGAVFSRSPLCKQEKKKKKADQEFKRV